MTNVAEVVTPRHRVSATLQTLAPHHAHDIASVIPFPHSLFFALSPARIHLLGLSLVGIDGPAIDPYVLTAKRWCDAVKVVADPGPIGIEGILAKMTLPMWSPEDYKRLWGLIGCPNALDYLQHATALAPHQIAILDELPPSIRHDSIVRHLRRPLEARVLAHSFGDLKCAKMLLRAAKQSKNRKSLFGKASNVLSKAWKFAAAPEVDHPNITPIRTDAELRRVALRFRNCLRDHADKASVGEVAFYVYEGEEPAVVMISRPVAGTYVIEQMLGPGNSCLSTATQQVIREALAGVGVVDRREAARRKAIDHCLSALRLAQIDAAEELDRYCRVFFTQMEIAELPDEEFWPWWL